jgi:Flp pilus assembly protein TadG
MMRLFLLLLRDRSGNAAVEMALVFPFLLLLMFGSIDLGNYFLSEHVVDKAVRDAARYAARLPVVNSYGTTNYDCSTNTVATTAQTSIQQVARFGDPSGSGSARLPGWTSNSMATVTLTCDTTSTDSYVNAGIYTDFPNSGAVPVITVSATVPYSTLFGLAGLATATLNLNAQNQAAVIGA